MKTQRTTIKGPALTTRTGPWRTVCFDPVKQTAVFSGRTEARYATFDSARRAANKILARRRDIDRVAVHDRFGFVYAVWRKEGK